ncbi:hypothetical protein CYMTET_9614, partial [Cymbomonas tetramitiformis]
ADMASNSLGVIALSRKDAEFISSNLLSADTPQQPVQVVLPPLRDEVLKLAEAAEAAGGSTAVRARPFITCCVRLSPEKEPHRFAQIIEELAKRGVLEKYGVAPLLCGAQTTEYAESIKQRVRAASRNAVVYEDFMPPSKLAQVYGSARINFHPSLYDAFGMTVVEAASFGAPTLLNMGGIGAADLLRWVPNPCSPLFCPTGALLYPIQ